MDWNVIALEAYNAQQAIASSLNRPQFELFRYLAQFGINGELYNADSSGKGRCYREWVDLPFNGSFARLIMEYVYEQYEHPYGDWHRTQDVYFHVEWICRCGESIPTGGTFKAGDISALGEALATILGEPVNHYNLIAWHIERYHERDYWPECDNNVYAVENPARAIIAALHQSSFDWAGPRPMERRTVYLSRDKTVKRWARPVEKVLCYH